jgi:hypothetical protein
VSHIRILWSKVHILDPLKKRKKLNGTRTTVGRLIGFNNEILKLSEVLLFSEKIVTIYDVADNTLIKFLDTLDFKPVTYDLEVFTNGKNLIAVYVHDLLLVGPDKGKNTGN